MTHSFIRLVTRTPPAAVVIGCVGLILLAPAGAAAEIRITTMNAVVWDRNQVVRGSAPGAAGNPATLTLNGNPFPCTVAAGDTFSLPLLLGEGENSIVASIDSANVTLRSDTLKLTLGYRLRPTILPRATVSGSTVRLHASVLENPDTSALTFSWTPDVRNPAPLQITGANDSSATVDFPAPPLRGEYLFHLTVAAPDGDTVRVAAMVTAGPDSISAFDIRTDHASWIDSAIVYEITPYSFVRNGRLQDITARIPEIAALGVTAIWLQPTYATHSGGQGYDVTDYFAVRSDLGTESDLRALILAAHANGLRVMLDFVPNHTSIQHPYAKESSAYGTASHYYDFYQRAADNAAYSQHYRFYQGFVNYFWDELPNLNYDNPEVRRMIIEAGTYWVEKFDVDGYRVDVAWGVSARWPEFFKEWRIALKRVKPDILLLGEDKATWPSVFEERFDAAYDWAPEESWVSHWVWQPQYSSSSNPTIFNSSSSGSRSAMLRNAMTNGSSGYSPRAKILRFMENNDTFRFRSTHDVPRTRMAAALLMSLHGIPLLYNGQEIGLGGHPYSTSQVFASGSSIASQDPYGLYPYYSMLCGLRKRYDALRGDHFAEVAVSPGAAVYAYRRWEGNQNIVAVINMNSTSVNATLAIPVDQMQLDSMRTYYLNDLLTNGSIAATPAALRSLQCQIPGYGAKLFLLDTLLVTSAGSVAEAAIPTEFALDQNYPNPFNPATTIRWHMPSPARVKLTLYDMLGREVATLVDGQCEAGTHSVRLEAAGLASGAYIYRIAAGRSTAVRKLVVIK